MKEIKKKKIIRIVFIALFTLIIMGSIILFIILKQKTYIVKYNTLGGTIIHESKTNKQGELILPNKSPEKDNKIFNGWKYDDRFIFNNTLIDKNIELKADWLDKGYEYVQVIFSPGDGFDDLVVYVEKNQRVLEPIIPLKKNSSFEAWYLGNDEFDFNSRIEENIVLIGKWDTSSFIYSKDDKYYCFDKSFKIVDGKCSKKLEIKSDIDYYCEEGWELTKDNQCMMIDTSTASIDATPIYACPDGYQLNNDKCSKNVTTTPSTNYYCARGTLQGNGCYETKEQQVQWASLSNYSPAVKEQQKNKYASSCSTKGGRFVFTNDYCACFVTSTYSVGVPKQQTTCPSGYSLNGGICAGVQTIDAVIKEYTCPEEYINLEAKCYDKNKSIKYEEVKEKQVCRNQFELVDGKCIKNYEEEAFKKQ